MSICLSLDLVLSLINHHLPQSERQRESKRAQKIREREGGSLSSPQGDFSNPFSPPEEQMGEEEGQYWMNWNTGRAAEDTAADNWEPHMIFCDIWSI